MKHKWNDNHGEDRLYSGTGKFDVFSQADLIVVDRDNDGYLLKDKLGYDGEFIFTLRPERDYEAYAAMRVYAAAVHRRSPGLAAEITAELDRIEAEQGG